MKLVIKNPAPTDWRMEKWGDFHFGRSLSKYLEREGCTVTARYQPDWNEPVEADAVLVLRGKYPHPIPERERDVPHLAWIISHPGAVTAEELAGYHRVFVASTQLATQLAEAGVPAEPLLQATDPEAFVPGESDAVRRGVVFVGNTREQRREAVLLAAELGLAPRIWGRGWRQFPEAGVPVDSYYPNERLGELYGQARLGLNDHWPDMREHGFVNNRVFDALACGLPVLSDAYPALEELALPGVRTFADRDGFRAAVSEYLLGYPTLLGEAAEAVSRVHAEFSFAERARRLVECLRVAG